MTKEEAIHYLNFSIKEGCNEDECERILNLPEADMIKAAEKMAYYGDYLADRAMHEEREGI